MNWGVIKRVSNWGYWHTLDGRRFRAGDRVATLRGDVEVRGVVVSESLPSTICDHGNDCTIYTERLYLRATLGGVAACIPLVAGSTAAWLDTQPETKSADPYRTGVTACAVCGALEECPYCQVSVTFVNGQYGRTETTPGVCLACRGTWKEHVTELAEGASEYDAAAAAPYVRAAEKAWRKQNA